MQLAEDLMIRPAQNEDYEQVCRLFRHLDEYHAAIAPHHYQPFEGPPRSRAHYTRLLADPDGYFFVAETNEGLVGLGE